MKILSIESSAKAASVALVEDGKLISQFFGASALTHSKTLLKMAQDLLNSVDMTLSQVDAIAVAQGPGSFTGVRIGVAAAKGLCWGGDKPVIGVSTLEAMAWHLIDRTDCYIVPVMDARRSQVYNAVFKVENGALCRISPDRAISLQELIHEAKAADKPFFFVGDGSELCKKTFDAEGLTSFVPIAPLYYQTAWGVAMCAQGKDPIPADDLAPNYLRLSQAERERMERLARENNNQ